jgi:hypothetical protein
VTKGKQAKKGKEPMEIKGSSEKKQKIDAPIANAVLDFRGIHLEVIEIMYILSALRGETAADLLISPQAPATIGNTIERINSEGGDSWRAFLLNTSDAGFHWVKVFARPQSVDPEAYSVFLEDTLGSVSRGLTAIARDIRSSGYLVSASTSRSQLHDSWSCGFFGVLWLAAIDSLRARGDSTVSPDTIPPGTLETSQTGWHSVIEHIIDCRQNDINPRDLTPLPALFDNFTQLFLAGKPAPVTPMIECLTTALQFQKGAQLD